MELEIVTGSAEWFPRTAKDKDYVVFRPQQPVFVYERSDPFGHIPSSTKPRWCKFCYREGLTKPEYFDWYRSKENKWSLNFAPLITRGFLEHMGLDIFGADHDQVREMIYMAFRSDYHLPCDTKYPKWLYRIYIYTCFIRNQKLELTDTQLRDAYDLYRQRYPKENVVRSIYEFFNHDPELTEIGIRQVIPLEEFAT